MSKPGAYLQNYNNELVNCIEKLREQQKQLNTEISKDETVLDSLDKEIRELQGKRESLSAALAKKIETRNKMKSTLAEADAAYLKILESSQNLLKVLKHESISS